MTDDKVWKRVLEDLQTSVPAAGFASWIRPLKLQQTREASSGRTLCDVGCPSSFHRDIIDQRYYSQLQEALERVLRSQAELRLKVDTTIRSLSQEDSGPLFAQQTFSVDSQQVHAHQVGLREDFTFETFAVSSSNEMAHAAAQAVANNLGQAYNPLFLYGGVGVGKTHLMQAVAAAALSQHEPKTLIYCAGEEFTNEIIEAIQQKKTQQFRRRYRQVKGLFIDDIQFIAGKTTVQEEFFHTFNAILKSGGQVVMTSDQSPSEIPKLEDRLRSRFEAGLIVDIGKPDFELRTAILLIKAEQHSIELPMETAQLIAANIESARQLEGFLSLLLSESQLRKKEVTPSLVEGLLGKRVQTSQEAPPPLRPQEVIKEVAGYYSISVKEIRGRRRVRRFVDPRHIAMYLLRVDYKIPLTEIGSLFSDRDHTTVMHAVDKITQHLSDSSQLRTDVSEIRNQLHEAY